MARYQVEVDVDGSQYILNPNAFPENTANIKSFMAIMLVIYVDSVTVRKIEFKVLPDNQNSYLSIATTIIFFPGPKN